MKNLPFILLISSIMNLQAQNELTRIEESNYFSNGTKVFYVMYNAFNSSGVLGEIMKGIDTLQIADRNDKDVTNSLKAKAVIFSKDHFLETYKLNVQYFNKLTVAIEVSEIKLKTFKIISKNYGVFNNTVFYKFHTIENANASSFSVISDTYYPLSKDTNCVYYEHHVIKYANPKTFQIIEDQYAKDDKYVFKRNEMLKNADPNTFQVLTHTYQKDKNTIWQVGNATSIDATSFKIVEYNYPDNQDVTKKSLYATDKNKVYFQGEIMPNADVKTFHILISGAPYQMYGIDKKHVFYSGELIKDADVKTFEVVKTKSATVHYDAQDKNYFYTRNEKTKK